MVGMGLIFSGGVISLTGILRLVAAGRDFDGWIAAFWTTPGRPGTCRGCEGALGRVPSVEDGSVFLEALLGFDDLPLRSSTLCK